MALIRRQPRSQRALALLAEASDPATTPERLSELVSSRRLAVLIALSANPSLPPEALSRLARNHLDLPVPVVANLLSHPNCQLWDAVWLLAQDGGFYCSLSSRHDDALEVVLARDLIRGPLDPALLSDGFDDVLSLLRDFSARLDADPARRSLAQKLLPLYLSDGLAALPRLLSAVDSVLPA